MSPGRAVKSQGGGRRAGPPSEAANFRRDGKLQTWLQGPDFGPLLVVDEQAMSWRQYNNVSIDTLYFSVFFGGSSPSFRAKKDEVRRTHACLPISTAVAETNRIVVGDLALQRAL